MLKNKIMYCMISFIRKTNDWREIETRSAVAWGKTGAGITKGQEKCFGMKQVFTKLPYGSVGKASACNVGDPGLIPG